MGILNNTAYTPGISAESSSLEYKREIPSDDRKWLKTIVAFANGKGGQLVFGIDDETHTVVGVPIENIARTVDRITEIIVNNCTPQIIPDIRVDTLAGKYVVVVEILPGQNTPYYLTRYGMEEGTYIRAAASTRLAAPHIRLELILRSRGLTYDQYPAPHQEAVSDDEVRELCRIIGERSGRKNEVTREHLISWGLIIPDDKGSALPTITFCLLARPRALHFSRIQCGVFLSNDRSHFLDNTELSGPVYDIAETAVDYVLKNTRVAYKINGLYREEQYEIPLPALREIIVNAVLHRNYLSPSYIQIAIHPDRVEFFSPGALHGNMTKERMLRGNSSSLRNPLLADIFHRMNIVERWGSGIGRIYAACEELGIAPPEYQVDEVGVTVIVRRHQVAPAPQPPPRKSRTPQTQRENSARTTVSEDDIAQFISAHPNCTFSQILKSFALSRRTLTNRLNALQSAGRIYRTGSTRNAVWNICV